MCAAGWISMPGERAREHRDQARQQRHAGLVQRVRDAVGEQRVDAGPGREDLGRPRRRAPPGRARARRARRDGPPRTTRANAPKRGHGNSVAATCGRRRAAPVGDAARARRTPARRSARRSRASRRRSACPWTPGARRPAARPRAPRRRRCRPAGRSRRAQRQAVLDRVVVGDRDHLVEQLAVEHRRARSRRRCPGCGAGRALRPRARPSRCGSTATTRSFGLACSRRYSPTPVIVPPVPTPATSTSTSPSSARAISGPGRAPVGLGVGGVGELVGQEDVRLARHRARRLDRLAHPAERLGDVDARAVQPQQALALAAHPLRQREHELIALGGADERERDAGVAAGRLDDRGASRLDPPFGLGRLDHRDADAVLDAAAGVEGLELGEQLHAVLRRAVPSSMRRKLTSGVSPTSSAMLIGISAIGPTIVGQERLCPPLAVVRQGPYDRPRAVHAAGWCPLGFCMTSSPGQGPPGPDGLSGSCLQGGAGHLDRVPPSAVRIRLPRVGALSGPGRESRFTSRLPPMIGPPDCSPQRRAG